MTEGWIKIHRKLIDWEWLDCPEMVGLWVNLLLRANYEDKEWHGRTIKRGQMVTSIRDIAKFSGLSLQQARTCIERLKSTHEITQESTRLFTIITICNYDRYQGDEECANTRSGTPSNKQITHRQPSIPYSSSSKSKHIQEKEIDTNVSTKKVDGSEEFLAFQAWILTHSPEVAKMQQPFTESQYRSLQQNYTSREVAEVLEDMSNSANLLKKYKSAYLTCKSWLKMRRERRGGMPMAQPQRKPSKVLSMMQEMASAGIDITQPTELL